jgi:single-strand DNA-binding protein
MSDTITLTGLVATPPKHIVTSEGLQITSFRLASTARRFDRTEQKWVDAETNWYTVASFRALAANVANSLLKGQRVVVTGRLKVRDWDTGEKTGTSVEIDAEAIGHDLTFGTSEFTRTPAATAASAAEAPRAEESAGDAGVDELAEQRAKHPSELAVPF